jgi:hypothetical protein
MFTTSGLRWKRPISVGSMNPFWHPTPSDANSSVVVRPAFQVEPREFCGGRKSALLSERVRTRRNGANRQKPSRTTARAGGAPTASHVLGHAFSRTGEAKYARAANKSSEHFPRPNVRRADDAARRQEQWALCRRISNRATRDLVADTLPQQEIRSSAPEQIL